MLEGLGFKVPRLGFRAPTCDIPCKTAYGVSSQDPTKILENLCGAVLPSYAWGVCLFRLRRIQSTRVANLKCAARMHENKFYKDV